MVTRSITISLAQSPIIKGDVANNLQSHLLFIEESSALDADIIVFPELSLTGYELALAEVLAFKTDADEFAALSHAARENDITVIAGCPLVSGSNKPAIGAVICFPNGKVEFYSKQYLHDGESEYCSKGAIDYFLSVKGFHIGLAICADFSEPKHSQSAANDGADIYLASALISENGFEADADILSSIAANYKIPVLLSNHISDTGGWSVCGNNTMWDRAGEIVVGSGHRDAGLVLCTIEGDNMHGRVITI